MAMATRNIATDIQEEIKRAIKKEINKVFDEHIKLAVEEAEAQRERVVAGASLNIASWMTMHDMGRTLRIEITKPGNQ